MSNADETPKNKPIDPSIGGDKISPEMNAALHAAKEEDAANQPPATEGETTPEDAPPSPESIAEVQEAISNILGEDEEAINTSEAANTPSPQDELAGMKEQLIRTMADMENLRKRSERELADSRKYAVTGFARDLVNVVENLQLAIQNIPAEDRKQDEKLENLAQGVEMTYNELIRIFEGNGIVRIDPKGEKFNHNHHQAVAQVEDAEAEPGSVIDVLQAGYIIHDRLLRPAMVTVAKGGDKSESITTQA